ncbi:hypothetical protein Tco_1555429 [Tanacetum coccineum]
MVFHQQSLPNSALILLSLALLVNIPEIIAPCTFALSRCSKKSRQILLHSNIPLRRSFRASPKHHRGVPSLNLCKFRQCTSSVLLVFVHKWKPQGSKYGVIPHLVFSDWIKTLNAIPFFNVRISTFSLYEKKQHVFNVLDPKSLEVAFFELVKNVVIPPYSDPVKMALVMAIRTISTFGSNNSSF